MSDKSDKTRAGLYEQRLQEMREEILEAYKKAGSWSGALRLILEEEASEEQLESLEQTKEDFYKGLRSDGLSEEAVARIKESDEEAPDELPSDYMEPDFWEILIDLIEESRGSKIADAKELQEITGLTEYSLEEVNKWLTWGRWSKYNKALKAALEGGGKYADLLKIEPSAYGLPQEWESYENEGAQIGKERAVVNAICWHYGLPEWSAIRPSPREAAEASGAPYPLILEAMGDFHKYGF